MHLDAATLKRPWVKYSLYAVAGFGAIFIAYRYVGGGTVGQTTVQGGSSTDPALAQLQGQQNALQAASADRASQQSYNLALSAQNNATDLEKTKLIAQMTANDNVNQITGSLQLAQIQAHSAADITATNAQTQVNLATINANNITANLDATVRLGEAERAAQITQSAINANATRANAETAAATLTTLAGISATTQVTTVGSNNNLAAHISDNQTNVAIAQSTNAANASNTVSNNQTSASNTSSTMATLGTIASVAAMFFSDRRLKTNIVRIGTHNLGIGIYSFNYIWAPQIENALIGVMADEVLTVMPEAISERNGYIMVDYVVLNAKHG